jgi:hypothetical protein
MFTSGNANSTHSIPRRPLFFDEGYLRFSYTFDLERADTWCRVHAYSRQAIRKRQLLRTSVCGRLKKTSRGADSLGVNH